MQKVEEERLANIQAAKRMQAWDEPDNADDEQAEIDAFPWHRPHALDIHCAVDAQFRNSDGSECRRDVKQEERQPDYSPPAWLREAADVRSNSRDRRSPIRFSRDSRDS